MILRNKEAPTESRGYYHLRLRDRVVDMIIDLSYLGCANTRKAVRGFIVTTLSKISNLFPILRLFNLK